MTEAAPQTAYYLNPTIPAVALIAQGVRFPVGNWRWVASDTAQAWHVEEMLAEIFPALKGALIFATLATDFDVEEFERSLQVAS